MSAAVLNPEGIIAADEKHLLIEAVLLMLIVVIPVVILTIIIAWRYRASNTKAKYEPDWSHNTLLEVVWWTIPIIIIAILATITWISSHRLDPYRPLDVKAKPLTIQVIALEWKWLFIYPEQNIATLNYVQLPVNTPVRFLITSDAPMNSFQIPQLAGQIYAMAGMQTKLNVLANQVGNYRGLSTNYSGDGFNYMNFDAHVSTPDQFNQWVKTVQKSSNKLTMDAYNKLVLPTKDDPVKYFSGVSDNLFNIVIMKFMMPMKDMKMMSHQNNLQGMMKAMQVQEMKKKSQEKQNKDYSKDRDYQSRYNKNAVPPAHK